MKLSAIRGVTLSRPWGAQAGYPDLRNSMEERTIELEPAAGPLLGGQYLETRRPPAGPDRLDEFGGKRLPLHLPREGRRIVGDRDERRLVPACVQERVPHVDPPVIGGPSHGARRHEQAAARKGPLPVDPPVCADNGLGFGFLGK